MDRQNFFICLVLLLIPQLVFADITYKMRYNAQTGRGDWVTDAASIYTAISDLDDIFIKADGTSTTTASIPFAKGLSFTQYDNGNSGSSKTIDWSVSPMQKITLTANCTLTFTAPPNDVPFLELEIIQGSGPYTITWPTIGWPGNVTPKLSTTNGARDVVTFSKRGASTYIGKGFAFNT